MRNYINGRYFQSGDIVEIFEKSSGEDILEELRKEYPYGLTLKGLARRTDIKYSTIDSHISALTRNFFIRDMKSQNDKRREVNTRVKEIAIEDVNKLSQLMYPYQLSAGNVEFSDDFKNAWYILTKAEEENQLRKDLLAFLSRVIRRVKELDHPDMRNIFPSSSNKDFCCANCGLNHEARDFIRSTLLFLLDQVETSKEYLEFLRENNYVDDQHYRHYRTIIVEKIDKKAKREIISIKDEEKYTPEETLRLRIISKGNINSSGYFNSLALSEGAGMIPLAVDKNLLSDDIEIDTMIECIPSAILNNTVFVGKGNSKLRIIEDNNSIKKQSFLIRKKIGKISKERYEENEIIFGRIEGTVVRTPDETESEDEEEPEEPRPPKSRLLIADDSGRAELTYEGFLSSQVDIVKTSHWKRVAHVASSGLRVGDRIKILGATTQPDESGELVIVLQPYTSSTIEPPILRILSVSKPGNYINFLGINQDRKFFHGSLNQQYYGLPEDTLVKCNREKMQEAKQFGESYLSLDLSHEDSCHLLTDENSDIPMLSDIYSKVKDVGKDDSVRLYFIQNASIMNKPGINYDDHGNPVTIDTIVEDETGKIALSEQGEGDYLNNFNIGDKIKIVGAFLISEGHLLLDTYGSIARA